jgi:hypothetical protein
MLATAAAGPSAFWYLTRGTGTISLLLLTVSVALGVANVRRVHTPAMPRFVLDAVHRNASLLAVAFVVVHVVTSLLDGYAPISLLDAVIPFTSAYRPVWLGFGALAFDLLLAVALTSLVRRRLGYRAWRGVHWAAYASWPVALLHGLGTGSDTKTGWMLVFTGVCVIVVIVSVVARATAGWPQHLGARTTALAASALVPVGLLVWLPSGPLAAGWAKQAGTPPALLGATGAATTSGATTTPARTTGGSNHPAPPHTVFTAAVSGHVSQAQSPSGLEHVDISLSVSRQQLSALHIRIVGQPSGGGVQMTGSSVTLGTPADPGLYTGTVVGLEGTHVQASLHDSGGHSLTLTARLDIDQTTGAAGGTVRTR